MIKVENLSKKYYDKLVLKNVSLELANDKITAFIGSNGAGKSTILNIISRLIPANEGIVNIDNQELKKWNNKSLAKTLTILGQTLTTPARLTVKELVSFGRFPHCGGKMTQKDFEIVEESINYTNISNIKDCYLDELSGGQRQIAYIAMAIAQDTKYILLDEPLNNLDMGRSKLIMQVLKSLCTKKQKTIFIVIHDINFASFYADYIIAFKNGNLLCQGKTCDIINEKVLKNIYDIDIKIETFNDKKLCIYY